MHTRPRSASSVRPLSSLLSIGVLIVLLAPGSVAGPQQPEHRWPEVALQLGLPDQSMPRLRFPGGGMTLIPRRSLNIVDRVAAGDFTAIDLWAKAEGDSMTIRLSIIYNDISNQEWWKDKKEKVAGTWVVKRGESVRPSELAAFGIEPFEMSVIDASPVILKPGEARIINKTNSLEVAGLEKQLDRCSIAIRNRSNKNVVSYSISIGNSGVGARSFRFGPPLIAAGATKRDQFLQCSDKGDEEIVISSVIFDDDSYEGDSKFAIRVLANTEGMRIQVPYVFRRLERTLAIEDNDLRAAFDRLEADLWVIPEAIDKPSALELLKKKFPTLESKAVSDLYEDLKGGLYEGRNIALSSIGETRRTIQGMEERGEFASAVEQIRRALERLRESLGEIINARSQ